MKKLLVMALVLISASIAQAYNEGGGDGAPWPFTWGKECPFPWDDIEGNWKVEGKAAAGNSGDGLVFTAEENVADGKLLFVEHYNRKGLLVGRGTGYADTTNKITRAIMTGTKSGERYRLLVRSYSALKSSTCSARQVMAVTFCPIRGKKCLDTSNYTLSRETKR